MLYLDKNFIILMSMNTRPNSAADCINFLVSRFQSLSYVEVGEKKLHALLYLALREGYAIFRRSIFEGTFVYLPEGPFCVELDAMNMTQRRLFHGECEITHTAKLILTSILEQYGALDLPALVSRIEDDLAWTKAKSWSSDSCNGVLDPKLIEVDSQKVNVLKSLWCMDHSTLLESPSLHTA